MNGPRSQYEETADRIRDEFLTTLRELDRRRRQLTDVRLQLNRHRQQLLAAAGGAAALAAGVAIIAPLRRRTARRRTLQRRLQGLARAWRHPERLATRAAGRPLPAEVGRKLAARAASAVGARLMRRLAGQLIP
jgi:hypothetical protein